MTEQPLTIVAARDAVPALVAEVRRLRALLPRPAGSDTPLTVDPDDYPIH